MKRRIWLTSCAAAVLLCTFVPAQVSAGGWAITSLDPFEQPIAGQATAIGFTILQHGVTPVDLDDVGIRVFEAGKAAQFFPAVADGPERVGHYTARVVFPSAGTFTWLVEQGYFAPQDLGQITITGGAASPGAASSAQQPAVLRYGLPLIAALCLVIVIGETGRDRRRLAAH